MATPAQKKRAQKRLADIRGAKNSTHKWRNLLARFFKLWATPIGIGTVIAVSTLFWGVLSFYLQQQSALQSELDQQQETTLQTYIDNIQDLLLNHNQEVTVFLLSSAQQECNPRNAW